MFSPFGVKSQEVKFKIYYYLYIIFYRHQKFLMILAYI
nr:MAG TPA: hypothetical protein [Caudoviricetes sp.]